MDLLHARTSWVMSITGNQLRLPIQYIHKYIMAFIEQYFALLIQLFELGVEMNVVWNGVQNRIASHGDSVSCANLFF